MQTRSRYYTFESQISENDLSRSFVVRSLQSGQKCFVKAASETSPIGLAKANAVLTESFRCQLKLHSNLVLHARRRLVEDNIVLVEYPYRDNSIWKELATEQMVDGIRSLLPILCLIIDYTHSFGLVHCDLKLENFLVRQHASGLQVLLADLDFMREDGSIRDATILGTPDHIAPEIVADEGATIRSDTYSFGAMLARLLDETGNGGTNGVCFDVEVRGKLKAAVDTLCQSDVLNRPCYLIDYFHQIGMFSSETRREYERRLLAEILLTHFITGRRTSFWNGKDLGKFVREDCKVLGLPDELLDFLAHAYCVGPVRALRAIRQFLHASGVERHGGFWHLLPTDKALSEFYDNLESTANGASLSEPSAINRVGNDLLQKFEDLSNKGKTHRAYTTFNRLLDDHSPVIEQIPAADRWKILLTAGKQAIEHNRLNSALSLLDQSVTAARQCGCDGIEPAFEFITALGRLGNVERGLTMVETEIAWSENHHQATYALRLRRLKAWFLVVQGEYDKAISELIALKKDASAASALEVLCMTSYTNSVAEWQRGNLATSIAEGKWAYQFALENGLDNLACPIACHLAGRYFESTQYHRAVEFGKLTMKMIVDHHRTELESSVCTVLVSAYTRLSEHAKAKYWLQRYLYTSGAEEPGAKTASYYLLSGLVALNEGDLDQANRELTMALEVRLEVTSARVRGKVYQNLAEIALYRGASDIASDYILRGKETFKKVVDRTALAEFDLIGLLLDYQAALKDDPKPLEDQIARLTSLNCGYYAAMGILYLMIRFEDVSSQLILSLARPLKPFLKPPTAPILEATGFLVDTICKEKDLRNDATALKRAYVCLLNGGQWLFAALLCRKLSDIYIASGQAKHAKKYTKQSLELSVRLRNPAQITSCEKALAEFSRMTDQTELMNSLEDISRILRGLGDFKSSLESLVRFAMNHSGAERGVLLLQRTGDSSLYAAASVDCDETSLGDVVAFSSQLPRQSLSDPAPVIIENALQDNRTKKYKSIVAHNIMSVACVPLLDGSSPIGVLYLDHHSIPALFEHDDLRYIEAIGNFLTVFLSTAREFRNLSLTNLQLLQDLNRTGDPDSFVTQDPSMLRLFETLPQIAVSNASVLILGESGTGKELLGQMLHHLSNRRSGPLVKVNCAAIPSALIEAELFGVAKRTATGVGERDGKFSAADGGTLYLDEIGDMPEEVQAKLLRVLEYQQFEKVGSNRPIHTDIRFAYATNKDLRSLIAGGKFREELFHRINRIVIEVSPLRDRADDIPLLLEHYVKIFSRETRAPYFSAPTLDILVNYSWPGNVRELRNLVERHCILHPGSRIEPADLPVEYLKQESAAGLRTKFHPSGEARLIRAALSSSRGNQSHAARSLGQPLSTFRRKMKIYGIS